MITAIYSLLHLLVDGICAFAMFGKFVAEPSCYEYFLIYNFCAFALQMPFGAVLDVLAEKSREKASSVCAVAGVLLTILGAFTYPAVLGVGNALFHVGGGVDVIREDNAHNWKGQALGIFVAPGALGLFIGTQLAKHCDTGLWWNILGITAIFSLGCIAALYFVLKKLSTQVVKPKMETSTGIEKSKEQNGLSKNNTYMCAEKNQARILVPEQFDNKIVAVTVCCFLVVILRSYIGIAVSFPWKTTLLLSTISILAVVLGKMAGGILSAKLGMAKTIIVSLIFSAICYLLSDSAVFGIGALFFFNMTMPITLYLLVCKCKTLPGFSFGLLTFGLFLGFLPVYFGLEFQISGKIIGMLGSIISMLLLVLFCIPKVQQKRQQQKGMK